MVSVLCVCVSDTTVGSLFRPQSDEVSMIPWVKCEAGSQHTATPRVE